MWGVYIFAGGAWAAMAMSIIALSYVRSQGYLKKIVTDGALPSHGQAPLVLHDLLGATSPSASSS